MTSVRFPSARLVLAVGLAALVASAPFAQVQGVGYRLSPSATYVLFDGDAALSDGLLYGGGAGLSFGEFLELNGAYLLGDVDTDYSDLSGAEADLLAARKWEGFGSTAIAFALFLVFLLYPSTSSMIFCTFIRTL